MPSVALVVVGLTQDYLDPARPGSETSREALAPATDAVTSARGRGDRVVFAPRAYDPDGSNIEFMRRAKFEAYRARFGRWPMQGGTEGLRYPDELAPRPEDTVRVRRAFSAFFANDLALWLAQHGVARVVIAGSNASTCVMATALDAISHGLRVGLCVDALGDTSRDQLAASLRFFKETLELPMLDSRGAGWESF